MRITEIKVSLGATVNMGNYESAKPLFEATASVDVSLDDLGKTFDELSNKVRTTLVEEINSIRRSA